MSRRTDPAPFRVTVTTTDGSALLVTRGPDGVHLTITNADGMTTAVLSGDDIAVLNPALRSADYASGR